MFEECVRDATFKEGNESVGYISKTKKVLEMAVDNIVKQLVPAGSKMKCHVSISTEEEVPTNRSTDDVDNNCSTSVVLTTTGVLREEGSESSSVTTTDEEDSTPSLVEEMSGAPVIDDIAPVCLETTESKKKTKLMTDMGTEMVTRIVSMSLHERRSVLAAYCKNHSKKTV